MEIRDAIHHTFIGFMLILISRIMKCINTSALGDYAGESGFNLSTIINVISNMMACISVVVVIGGIVVIIKIVFQTEIRIWENMFQQS